MVLLKKNPPFATGPSQGGNAGNISRFATAFCVLIHTSGRKRLPRWCVRDASCQVPVDWRQRAGRQRGAGVSIGVAWPNLKMENISKLRCSVNGTPLANIWIAGTAQFFELTKL
jgi:hypothetical protein